MMPCHSPLPPRPPAERRAPTWLSSLRIATQSFALVLALTFLTPSLLAAETTVAPSTNTIITCLNGASWFPTNAIFRGNVRVFDPQMYLESEILTVYFPSNNTSTGTKPGATPDMGSVSSIVAETNLLMMMRGATIIGDRAVYSATNELIQITGEIVVIETESGYAYGTNFVFNRRSMELQSIGPSTLESKAGVSLMNTNKLPTAPGAQPNRPRRTPTIP